MSISSRLLFQQYLTNQQFQHSQPRPSQSLHLRFTRLRRTDPRSRRRLVSRAPYFKHFTVFIVLPRLANMSMAFSESRGIIAKELMIGKRTGLARKPNAITHTWFIIIKILTDCWGRQGFGLAEQADETFDREVEGCEAGSFLQYCAFIGKLDLLPARANADVEGGLCRWIFSS